MKLYNIEVEQDILGAIMNEPLVLLEVAKQVRVIDFYQPNHQIIYQSILENYDSAQLPTSLMIAETLQGKLDLLGGNHYLVELMDLHINGTFHQSHIDILKKYSALRLLSKTGTYIEHLINKEYEPQEIVEEVTKSFVTIHDSRKEKGFKEIKEILNDTFENLSESHANPVSQYIPTGFKSLDQVLSGFHKSDLVILAANPSMGKSTLALNIASNMAKNGQNIGFISLEMSNHQLAMKLISTYGGIDSKIMTESRLNDQDWSNVGKAIDQLANYKFYVDDSLGGSINELKFKIRKLQVEHGLDVLFIDYLQLLSGDKYKDNRVNEISEITRSLKKIARELNIVIVALSQLSRENTKRLDKKPMLSDLRESGSIEQDADIVMMMYREEYFLPATERKGITEIFIRKHRNGPTGEAQLLFENKRSLFTDRFPNYNMS